MSMLPAWSIGTAMPSPPAPAPAPAPAGAGRGFCCCCCCCCASYDVRRLVNDMARHVVQTYLEKILRLCWTLYLRDGNSGCCCRCCGGCSRCSATSGRSMMWVRVCKLLQMLGNALIRTVISEFGTLINESTKRTLNRYSTARSGWLKLALSAFTTCSLSKPISIKLLIVFWYSAPRTNVLSSLTARSG